VSVFEWCEGPDFITGLREMSRRVYVRAGGESVTAWVYRGERGWGWELTYHGELVGVGRASSRRGARWAASAAVRRLPFEMFTYTHRIAS